MTIAYVRGASGAAQTGTACTISFDATGCDMLVVGSRDLGTSQLITGATYNGVAMTQSRHDGTSGRATTIFTLVAPTSGVHDIVVSYSSGATGIGVIAGGFSGVHQSTPIGNTAGRSDAVGGSGTGPTVNVPITMSAGSVAVDFFVLTKGDSTTAPTPGGSQTAITTGVLEAGGFGYERMSYLAGATQMSWTWSGPSAIGQSHSVIELKASGASTVSGVTVSPLTPSVTGGTTQQFTAAVAGTGGPSQSVSWAATAGSIDSAGLFTAPASTGSAQTITVTATSSQDGTKSGTATVTVPAFSGTVTSVTVSPTAPAVTGSTTQQFTAVVNGTGGPSQSVTWAASIGSITFGGLWTAPTATGSIQTATITATSVQNTGVSGTASPTVPAAIVPVLSVGFRSVFAQSFQYEDRVKDTTTTTGTGTITLAGAAPAGYRTFASAFPAGAKRIAYLIEDASTGEWEAGLGTLATGTTLSRDTLLSSSTGSAISFAAGVKNIFCAVTAAAVKRFAVKDFIDLRDYDVDPTFTSDSTVGIQTAINDAFLSGIQDIQVPPGRYKLSGPVNNATGDGFGRGCNGQLYIPASQHDTNMKHIRIIGSGGPVWQYGAINDEPVQTGGVIFESTLTNAQATGTQPSVICASYGYNNGFGFFNYTDFTLENIVIRTNTTGGANKMCGVNGLNMSNGVMLHNVRIDTNRGLRTSVDASGVASIGYLSSPINNSGGFKCGYVFISGYTTGAQFSEHMSIDRLTVYGCLNGIVLKNAYHGSWIGMLNVECCKNGIVIDGDHSLGIGTYDAEHDYFGTWNSFTYDIKYNSGSRKVAILNSIVVKGSVGIDDTDWATNATSANYKVVAGAGAN